MPHGRRVLVLDLSEDVLIRVQQVLEDSGIDTTTTAQVGEAVERMATGFFDFLVVGNRPPLLDAARILRDLRDRGVCFDFYILGNGEEGLREYGELVDQIRTSAPPSLRPRQRHRQESYGSWSLGEERSGEAGALADLSSVGVTVTV